MTIALLATGDELITGDTLNTNSHKIANALASEGLLIGLHLTTGDAEDQIVECIDFLCKQHDVLIITGGLGPTSDDRTRFALARYLDTPLLPYAEAMNHIQHHLRRTTLSISAGNQQQAMFTVNANLLPNPFGTAMGCSCVWGDKLFILLPGPPRECLPMFNNHVLPLLKDKTHTTNIQLKWRLFGVAESQIAQIIDDALAHLDVETGYRLETPYVECKVRCDRQLADEVETILSPLLEPHIISSTELKASEQLKALIEEKQIKLSIEDHATGGLLQCLLQQPSNSYLLHFNSKKPQPLHVEFSGLEEYWQSQEGKNETCVTINYSYQQSKGQETHQLPYRTALVVHIAAEWLCFRLIHLIERIAATE